MSRKTLAVTAALVIGVMGLAGQAAAQTDTITVTVSLTETIEVSLDTNTWAIGAIALGSTNGPQAFTATVGNIETDLAIRASDGTGGWTLGSPAGADTFEVTSDTGASPLTTGDQVLSADVAAYGNVTFNLTYNAPTSDTFGGGVDQGFTITLTASDST